MPLKKRESCAEPRSFIGLNRKVLGAYARALCAYATVHTLSVCMRTPLHTHMRTFFVLPSFQKNLLPKKFPRKKPTFACSGGRSGKVQFAGEGSGKGKVWSVAWEALQVGKILGSRKKGTCELKYLSRVSGVFSGIKKKKRIARVKKKATFT